MCDKLIVFMLFILSILLILCVLSASLILFMTNFRDYGMTKQRRENV